MEMRKKLTIQEKEGKGERKRMENFKNGLLRTKVDR
jgi:hypothetical protein